MRSYMFVLVPLLLGIYEQRAWLQFPDRTPLIWGTPSAFYQPRSRPLCEHQAGLAAAGSALIKGRLLGHDHFEQMPQPMS